MGEDVLAVGLISKTRKPHEAKLLTVDAFRCGGCCGLGLLQEKARLDTGRGIGLLRNAEAINGLPGSHKWDHSLRFMCEDMVTRSWLGGGRLQSVESCK